MRRRTVEKIKHVEIKLQDIYNFKYFFFSNIITGTKSAPIYDRGKSLFVQDSVPTNDRDLLSIKTESFVGSELKMLKFVKDRNCLDVSKLPERKWLEELYAVDSKMDENRIKLIGEGYERKIELFRRFQLGEDLNRIRLAVPARKETRSGQ